MSEGFYTVVRMALEDSLSNNGIDGEQYRRAVECLGKLTRGYETLERKLHRANAVLAELGLTLENHQAELAAERKKELES